MQRFLYESCCGMITIQYKGITWTVGEKRNGRSTLNYEECSIVWEGQTETYQFFHGTDFVFARELRSDALSDATDCILDAFAGTFVPCWETPNGTTQEAP